MRNPSGPVVARPGRRVPALAVVVISLLVVGAFIGHRSPWGTQHPRVHEGVAMRANAENDLVLFDSGDGTQATFGADDTWWESGTASGEGDAPCLDVPLRKADVQVGLMRVAGPSGGWHMEVVWVKCL